jgi:hypothetical protein
MKRLIILVTILIFAFSVNLWSQGVIRGFVYEKKSGEAVSFANVFLNGTKIGGATDINGFFNLTKVPAGNYTLRVNFIGYDTISIQVSVKDKELVTKKIYVTESAVMLNETVVSAEKQDKTEQVRISINKITPKQIERIPSVGGEPDFAQYLQVVPGVVFTGDQGGQLYIRGCSPIQNKVLLDGMIVYNPFHSIGFFSVFDSDLIRNADVYTGGFNADYGGRISSIMDITMRDGNKNRQAGKIAASTFGSKLLLEGPIFKGEDNTKTSLSYVFSGKTSFIKESSKVLYNYVDTAGIPFSFTDFYGKLTLNTENGSKINIFGFKFNDKVKYKELSNLDWNSFGVGSNIILVPSGSPFLLKINMSFSNYEITLNEVDQLPKSSLINGYNLGLTFVYFVGKNELNYGIETLGFKTSFDFYNSANRKIDQQQNTSELGGFFKYKINKNKFLIEPGLRIQYYASLSALSPEPRIGVKYSMSKNFRLKFAGGLYSQNFVSATSDRDVVNLFYGFLSSPEIGDLQKEFDGKAIKNSLQKSWHTILGCEIDLTKSIDLNIEGYVKRNTQLTNLNRNKIYDDIAENYDKPDYLKKDFVIETGNAYGVDFTVKYDFKRTYFWAVYSLGFVDRFDGFNTYRPHYDRRHNINLVATRTFGRGLDWELSARWNFGSGFPFSKTAGYYEKLPFSTGVNSDIVSANGEMGIIYGDLNEGRLPAYHRMDLTLKKSFELSKNSICEITFSTTNVYDRDNIFYYDRVKAKRVNQLPIIPSIGLNITF